MSNYNRTPISIDKSDTAEYLSTKFNKILFYKILFKYQQYCNQQQKFKNF